MNPMATDGPKDAADDWREVEETSLLAIKVVIPR